MPNPEKLLVVLLLDGHAACFVRDGQTRWQQEPIHGEAWYPLAGNNALAQVLDELDQRLNCSDQLAGFALHLVYEQSALPWLADVARALAAVRCGTWQVLRWEPLRDRAAMLSGQAPAASLPAIDWLQQSLLPVLEATFQYQDDALAAERARAEQQHADTLESLRADRLRLEAEIAIQREQLSALQRPAMDDVLAYLPAIYRNLFGSIAPHDLALLAGQLQVPPIPSPWPEPSPDTLHALQARLRKLPEPRATQLRDFCRQLPHPLELRVEMRAWLGAD
jgi:hypothetical protein